MSLENQDLQLLATRIDFNEFYKRSDPKLSESMKLSFYNYSTSEWPDSTLDTSGQCYPDQIAVVNDITKPLIPELDDCCKPTGNDNILNQTEDDDLMLCEVDLDRDLLLGDDVYETIYYYSRNINRNFVRSDFHFNFDDVTYTSDNECSGGEGESCIDVNVSIESSSVKNMEHSESSGSRSDFGTYSSNLNSTNDIIFDDKDETLTEVHINEETMKKKDSFSSFQTHKVSEDEYMGRSFSDSFLNRVKGFRFIWGRKHKAKSLSKTSANDESVSEGSQSKFEDSGVGSKSLNYGSTDLVKFEELDALQMLKGRQYGSFDKKYKSKKQQSGFNPCCVG